MFEEIVGHEDNKDIFERLIKSDRLKQSYLFVGNEGVGKKKFAYDIAKFYSGLDRNIHLIEAEKNNIPIDKIREVQEGIAVPPFNGSPNRRIVIIDDAHCMNANAQNALLKTLEEPPEYVMLFLICNDESKLLDTILSRCTSFRFNGLDEDEILDVILERISEKKLDKSFLEFLLVAIGGSYKVAREISEDANILNDYIELYNLFDSYIKTGKPSPKMYELYELLANKDTVRNRLKVLSNYCIKHFYKSNNKRYWSASKLLLVAYDNISRGGNVGLSLLTCFMDIIKKGD